MDKETKVQLEKIDNQISLLQSAREIILQSQELTTKEHYEYYHG